MRFIGNRCSEIHTLIKGINKTFRSSLFWDIMQCSLVVTYRRFRTTYQSHVQGLSSPRRNYSHFFCFVLFGQKSVQKIPTTIYCVIQSFTKLGAVKAILCLEASVNLYLYFPHLVPALRENRYKVCPCTAVVHF